MKFVDVKNDVAFHKIFGDANKTVTLISFLNAVLSLEGSKRVVTAIIENPYLFPPVPTGKTSVLDVRATDQEGRKFIVEMQVADKKGFEKRVQYYASRDYSTQIKSGDDYPKLRPTYFIGILNFDFTQNPNYISTHQTIDIETGEHLLKDVKYYFIELDKFEKEAVTLTSLVDKWIYFIKNAENLNLIPSNVDDEGLKAAYINADQQTWTKAELNIYDDSKVQEADIVQRELLLFEKVEQMLEKVEQKEIQIEQKEIQIEQKEIQIEQKEIRIEQREIQIEQREIKLILGMDIAGMPISQIASIMEKTEEEVRQILAKNR
jgi:predicted transposase/invertase (TIGR01784 family)